MQVEPIDLTGVIAVAMGMLIVLIPIAGLTARFALKPIAEAVARIREGQSSGQQLGLIEQRLSLLEQQLTGIELDVRRIEEFATFDRELRSPPKREAIPGSDPPTE